MNTESRATDEQQSRAGFNLNLQDTFNLTAREIEAEPSSTFHELAGRTLDILFALILAIAFSPVIVVVLIMLILSGGPVFFSQDRLGLGGQVFKVYKFRTMVPNAEAVLKSMLERDPALKQEWQQRFKLRHDPRVTLIGRFLRRTSLDELPQIWNILIGNMSLVGPRPVDPPEIAKYGRYARCYYAQRPGLTGLWQVSGRSNASYERRIALDTFYSRNRCLLLDLKIIFKTVRVVLTGHGAC